MYYLPYMLQSFLLLALLLLVHFVILLCPCPTFYLKKNRRYEKRWRGISNNTYAVLCINIYQIFHEGNKKSVSVNTSLFQLTIKIVADNVFTNIFKIKVVFVETLSEIRLCCFSKQRSTKTSFFYCGTTLFMPKENKDGRKKIVLGSLFFFLPSIWRGWKWEGVCQHRLLCRPIGKRTPVKNAGEKSRRTILFNTPKKNM